MDIQIRNKEPSISIVAPVFNEEENIEEFFLRVKKVLDKETKTWEIIFVDDGSSDKSIEILAQLNENDGKVKIISLSRNFGKELAMTAGLDFADNDVIVPIDSDLQDPPELIPQMVELWKEGFDVVLAVRSKRNNESWLKKKTAELFYKFIGNITEIRIPKNTGDFRLIDRHVLSSIKELRETQRFMKGIFSWVGYKTTSISYERDSRYAGKTKWNYWKLWNFAIEGITSFSTLPLRLATYIGLIISLSSLVYLISIIYKVITNGVDVPGYASTLTIILFLGGVILFFMGIIGEYVGRIYIEVKNRPLYIIRDRKGF